MDLYYICIGDSKEGPFDLVSMIRKIKSGKVSQSQLIVTESFPTPQEAITFEMLAPYFSANSESYEEARASRLEADAVDSQLEHLNLKSLLKRSWEQFQADQPIIIYVGMGGLLNLAFALMCSAIFPAFITLLLACCVAGVLVNFLCVFIYLRVSGRTIDESFAAQLRSSRGVQFVSHSAAMGAIFFAIPLIAFSIFAPLGVLLTLLGFLGFSLFIMAPFYWVDNPAEQNFQDMLVRSMRWVRAQNKDTQGKIMCIFSINMFAAALMLFPLFASLPTTILAYIALYTQHAKENM